MANYFEKTTIDPLRFVPPTSRYAGSTVVYYTERKLLSFETYKKGNYSISRDDKFKVISPGEQYRPDLVSQKAYGFPDFWWKIMEANNIKDIFDFKVGLNIRIPKASF